MLGLIGTLELSKRGMDANRQGIELTGHNLANVSNRAYARQRLKFQTGDTLPGPVGPQGTGVKVVSIEQIRSRLLDSQIVTETGVTGFLEAKQKALEFGEVNLGQQLDRQSSTPEGAAANLGIGGQFGIIEGISDFFGAMQALSTTPNSTADRQVVLLKAQNLTEKFNNVAGRLARLRSDLNISVEDDVVVANQLITDIADLSKSIASSELSSGNANDLRDRRQEKLESLSKIANFTADSVNNNDFQLTIGDVSMLSGNSVVEQLKTTTDITTGKIQLQSVNLQSGTITPITLSFGSIQGTIDAREGAIQTLQLDIDTLASTLRTQINTAHKSGFSLAASITPDSSTDKITWNSHGLSDGSQVVFTARTIPELPGGLTAGTVYFVRDATADNFKLAATSGGAAIEITSNGTSVKASVTNMDFFTGTDGASDIQVNSVLLADPNKIHASGISGESGNNAKALAMAQLANTTQSLLGNLTFTENYNQTVANFGQELSNTNSQLLDQNAVNRMLERQRDSLGGVSIDEEMTNLIIFQRAFQASARMINSIDELLQSVIALAR